MSDRCASDSQGTAAVQRSESVNDSGECSYATDMQTERVADDLFHHSRGCCGGADHPEPSPDSE